MYMGLTGQSSVLRQLKCNHLADKGFELVRSHGCKRWPRCFELKAPSRKH